MENNNIKNVVKAIVDTYRDDSGINFIDTTNLPLRDRILEILGLLMEVLFPGYTGAKDITSANVSFVVGDILYQVQSQLTEQIERALLHQCRLKQCDSDSCRIMAQEAAEHLLAQLPKIRKIAQDRYPGCL